MRGTAHTGGRPQRCKRRAAVSGFYILRRIRQKWRICREVFEYTTDVVIEEQEFAESKRAAGEQAENAGYSDAGDGFMNIPDDVDGELPFM